MDEVTHQLELDGVKSFADSYDELITSAREKAGRLRAEMQAPGGTPATPNEITSTTVRQGVGKAVPLVAGDPHVAAYSVGYAGVPFQVGGIRADGIAMSPVRGEPITTPLLAGRLADRPGEIVLGAQSVRSAGTRLGGIVPVSLGNGPVDHLRVVGVAVFPSIEDSLTLGKGAAVTVGELRRLVPRSATLPPPDHVFVRFRAGSGAEARSRSSPQFTSSRRSPSAPPK